MGTLLADDEEPAVAICEGESAFVVICEHASNRLPRALGTLGLAPGDLERHIAFDPGAADLAEGLAETLSGALIRQRYSRLAIDCNRQPDLPDAIAVVSEGTPIPGNVNLSPQARAARIGEIWQPFHAAVAGLLDRRRVARRAALIATIHSFTPVYRGVARPWHAGIISTDDRRFSDGVLAGLRRVRGLAVGDNRPYSARDNVDHTIRRHGRDRGLPHVMIEIRNDLLRSGRDIADWTARLAVILQGVADQMDLSPLAAAATG